MLKTYKKTATIDAIQWTGFNTQEVMDWAASFGVEIVVTYKPNVDMSWYGVLRIPTLEGPMTASKNDFIAKGIKDEFWAIKPDVMAATYEEI